MRNVTLRQLRILSAVGRSLSFTRAARDMHLTQSAVSQQMKLLEREAAAPLFEHVGRRIQLTAAGDELLRHANRMLETLREADEALYALRGLQRGVLKFGAVSTAKYFAPSLLAAFTAVHPDITIKFTVGNREEIVQRLSANEIDLVIMGRPPRELETVAEPFASHPLVIIAAPDHPLASRKRLRLADLANERLLIRERGSGTRAALEHVFREHAASYRAAMEVSSNETIKQAVMAGMGVSFISMHTVGLELKAGRLVTLNVTGLPIVRQWYVIHLGSKRLSPIAAAFRTFLVERAAGIMERAVG